MLLLHYAVLNEAQHLEVIVVLPMRSHDGTALCCVCTQWCIYAVHAHLLHEGLHEPQRANERQLTL
jgi:hypothetical protein